MQLIHRAQDTLGYLSDLDLADITTNEDALEVDILIGSDYYWRFATRRVLRGKAGPTAVHTRLGWVLSGPLPGTEQRETATTLTMSTHALQVDGEATHTHSLDIQLKKFWDLEPLGTINDESSVYDKFASEISFDGRRYTVRLPWKEVHPELPDNFDLSH